MLEITPLTTYFNFRLQLLTQLFTHTFSQVQFWLFMLILQLSRFLFLSSLSELFSFNSIWKQNSILTIDNFMIASSFFSSEFWLIILLSKSSQESAWLPNPLIHLMKMSLCCLLSEGQRGWNSGLHEPYSTVFKHWEETLIKLRQPAFFSFSGTFMFSLIAMGRLLTFTHSISNYPNRSMYSLLGTVLVLNTDRNVLGVDYSMSNFVGTWRVLLSLRIWISVSEWYLLLPQYFSCSISSILSGLLWISNELIYVNHWEESVRWGEGKKNSPLQEYKCHASHFYLSLSNHFLFSHSLLYVWFPLA